MATLVIPPSEHQDGECPDNLQLKTHKPFLFSRNEIKMFFKSHYQ